MSCKFLVVISYLSEEEKDWIRNIPRPKGFPPFGRDECSWRDKFLTELKNYGIVESKFISDARLFPKCAIEIDEYDLRISSGEDGDPFHAACIVQGLFRKFRPNETLYFTWSAVYGNEFGGGFAAVSSTDIHCENTWKLGERAAEEMKPSPEAEAVWDLEKRVWRCKQCKKPIYPTADEDGCTRYVR